MIVETVEETIVKTLRQDNAPKDLDELVRGVRQHDEAVRAVDVKMAALDMVSRGRLALNERWQLSVR